MPRRKNLDCKMADGGQTGGALTTNEMNLSDGAGSGRRVKRVQEAPRMLAEPTFEVPLIGGGTSTGVVGWIWWSNARKNLAK